MKKYLITFIALISLYSCQKDELYENMNTDPKNPTEISAGFLFTSATVALSDQLQSPNVNLNITRFISQYLTATTYLDEPNYDLITRGIPGNHWDRIYAMLLDLKDAKAIVPENNLLTEEEKAARIAQIEVIEVYAWQVLVDTFGDIPYTEALQPNEFPLPAYDDAATIYEDLIARLTAARDGLQAGQGFTTADVIYEGDMVQWSKFANSLLLRLGMRLVDVNPGLSQTTAETAITGNHGLISQNSESATLAYEPSFPNTNPMWEDFVQSGRSDYVAANTIVDYMNTFNDPRRATYFDDNITPYTGGVYGASNSFSNYTHVGELFETPTIAGIFLDYAEVQFLLAEAAKAGYATPLSAEEHYNQAVTVSILYWNGTQSEADAYLLEPDVAYDGTDEQLATQFWIAMYNNPVEGWAVWRKFDAPELNVAASSGLPVPLRYTYPIDEQNLNQANWEAASSAIGGDQQQTPIFWDVQ